MRLAEIIELTQHLNELEIRTQTDLETAVAALEVAMSECDAIATQKNGATAALRKALTDALAPFKEPSEAVETLVAAAKSAIVRHYEAHEQLTKAAIAARAPVPVPLDRPKGLSVRRQLQLVSADPEALADEYLTAVPDADAILAAVESGTAVAGAETRILTSVSYRRSKSEG